MAQVVYEMTDEKCIQSAYCAEISVFSLEEEVFNSLRLIQNLDVLYPEHRRAAYAAFCLARRQGVHA